MISHQYYHMIYLLYAKLSRYLDRAVNWVSEGLNLTYLFLQCWASPIPLSQLELGGRLWIDFGRLNNVYWGSGIRSVNSRVLYQRTESSILSTDSRCNALRLGIFTSSSSDAYMPDDHICSSPEKMGRAVKQVDPNTYRKITEPPREQSIYKIKERNFGAMTPSSARDRSRDLELDYQ